MPRALLLAVLLAAPSLKQGAIEFPKTPDEAKDRRAAAETAIATADKDSTKRGLEALDEGRVLRVLASTYSEIETLLRAESAFEAEQAAFPKRQSDAEAALARETRREAAASESKPAEPDGASIARLTAEVDEKRLDLAELESSIGSTERLLAGGDVFERDATRDDLDEVERSQRDLEFGRTSLGPKAAALERERIALRQKLDQKKLQLFERRARFAQSLVLVQRAERDAKRLEIDRRVAVLKAAVSAVDARLDAERKAANGRLAAAEAKRAAATTPWEQARLDLDVEVARERAQIADDRLTSRRSAVDPDLSGRLAEERLRLSQLRQQFNSVGAAAGDVDPIDAYLSIEQLRRSKEIHDFEDESSDLDSTVSAARENASDARRRIRTLQTSLDLQLKNALAELDGAIAQGNATPADRAAFETAWAASAAELADATQDRARAATRTSEVASARARVIQRLLDTLAESESFVRSKGFFMRVGSQVRVQSVRDALLDVLVLARELPALVNQSAAATGAYLRDRSNLVAIVFGAVLFPLAIVLVLFTRRVARRFAKTPVGAEPTLVERARKLGIETARRAALIAFSALAVVVAAHLFFSHRLPALVRAVDAAAIVVVVVRVARVVVYLLFRPDSRAHRLVPATDATAKYVWRIASLASYAVLAVDVPRRVLDAIGYKARNPGFMELIGRAEQALLVAAIVLFFARKSVLDDLLPRGRSRPWELARNFVLRLRPVALTFAIAVFLVSLAGYRFLADYLESISLGGTAILVLTSLGIRATLQLGDRVKSKLPLGPEGSVIAARRLELLAQVGKVLTFVVFTLLAYEAFVVVSGTDIELLRSFGFGLVGGRRFTMADVLFFFLAIAGTALAAGWTRRGLDLFLLPLFPLDVGTRYAIAMSASYLVVVAGAFVALSMIRFELRDFAILLGAAGFGIGLGMQESASNFLNGLILLFSRRVKVGDVIESGDRTGQIVDITITTTRVLTPENHEILIPNREIVGKRLVNRTGRDPKVRIAVRVGVAYGTDLEKARTAMLVAAKAVPSVLADPPPEVAFLDFADSALALELRLWTPIGMRFDVETRARFEISRAFEKAGIEIPFPQRDLQVKGSLRLKRADGDDARPTTAP